jgi:hypothetical protein
MHAPRICNRHVLLGFVLAADAWQNLYRSFACQACTIKKHLVHMFRKQATNQKPAHSFVLQTDYGVWYTGEPALGVNLLTSMRKLCWWLHNDWLTCKTPKA